MTVSANPFPAYGGQNYSLCQIQNSFYNWSIAYDYDNNYQVDYVVMPDQNTIAVYNTLCDLVKTYTTTNQIVSRPSLVNPDYKVDPISHLPVYDLAILTNETLDIYNATGLKYQYNYLPNSYGVPIYALACTDHSCWANSMNSSISYSYRFSLVLGISYTNRVNVGVTFATIPDKDTESYAQTVNDNSYASFCDTSSSTTSARCFVVNETPGVVKTFTLYGGSNTLDMRSYFAGFVKMGSVYRYIATIHGTKSSPNRWVDNVVYDDSFNLLFTQCTGGTECLAGSAIVAYSSKPAVGDYDRDGVTEYCYFYNDTSNDTNFKCYTNSFINPKFTTSFNMLTTGMSHFPDEFYMANYNASAGTLYIGTKEGIFDIENEKKIFSTDFNYTSTSVYFDPIIISYLDRSLFDSINVEWTGNPTLAYASLTNSFIVASVLGVSFCGDLLCEGSETVFNCQSDCLTNFTAGGIPIGFECTDSANCTIGLCRYGKCALAGTNEACNTDNDCVSNNCNDQLLVCAKATLWQNIDSGKDEQFGDDSNSNNLIAILIIIVASVAVGIAIGKYGGGLLAGAVSALVFFVSSLFFAIVGWLSWYIVLVELILLVAFVVMGVLLGSRTS